MGYTPPDNSGNGSGASPQNSGYQTGARAPQGYSPSGQPPQYRPPVFNYKQQGSADKAAQSAAAGDSYSAPRSAGDPYGTDRSVGGRYTAPGSIGNPYGTQHPVGNPYGTQQPVGNPYGTQQPVGNPYGAQQPVGNPYGAAPRPKGGFSAQQGSYFARNTESNMPPQQPEQYSAPQTAGIFGDARRPVQNSYSGGAQPVNGYAPGQTGAGMFPPQQSLPYGYPTAQYPQQQTGPQEPYRSFIPPTPGMPSPPQPDMQTHAAYIPQTPYSMGSGMNAYHQAFDDYAPQQPDDRPSPSMPQYPLNGGGYVPKQPPIKREPFEFDNLKLIILCVVLVACFALGMFVPGLAYFKWIFAGLSALSIILFWIRNTLAGTKRLCFTIVFGALIVVSVVAGLNAARPSHASSQSVQKKTVSQQQAEGKYDDEETPLTAAGANQNVYTVKETPAPTEAANDTDDISTRLNEFFYMWSANKMDEMLSLCLPSWQRSVETPKTALFGIMANRTPLDYTVEKVSGSPGDTSRTVTLTSTIDRNNGKEPVMYRFSVIMVNEDGQWYVDPRSLSTNEEVSTPDPAAGTETPPPTIEPVADPSTVLYYNPDGGTKYHLDQYCKSTHEKFLPMTAHFTYAEVNDPQYANLKPCNVCAAPLRQ